MPIPCLELQKPTGGSLWRMDLRGWVERGCLGDALPGRREAINLGHTLQGRREEISLGDTQPGRR